MLSGRLAMAYLVTSHVNAPTPWAPVSSITRFLYKTFRSDYSIRPYITKPFIVAVLVHSFVS